MLIVLLLGTLVTLTLFSYSAVKPVNRAVFGACALALDIFMAFITIPALTGVPHSSMRLVANMGLPVMLFWLLIAIACTASITYNVIKSREADN